ncbi:MAG: imidazoleglycerol-phosphate dehydratase [Spirochaetaceae bacterium]|jgi:imidazoleglycerol-phosphate dehydratase|nr:imidazoleglycerol-phosphate dehydratase [Spirochaetaceae bacterium]
MNQRIAEVRRKTAETEISLTLNLDGTGRCDVDCPVGFLGHMLASFCKHGLFDLSGSLRGDLQVDQHHLVEDTGIVLGMAFAKALGDCRGIFRTGYFAFPMDETLATCAVDFGGRSFLVCNTDLSEAPLVSLGADGRESSFQTDTFEDFWQGFVSGARCNLHLDILRGRSDHHKMEALFKAASRAVRAAVAVDPRRADAIPSAKGVIV